MTTPDAYAQNHSSALSPLLQQILDYTLEHHPHAHMISGHVQGQFLQLFSKALKPHRILEIGTFTGFSGLCLAEGLPQDGHLFTLELREADANTALGFFKQSKWAGQITCLVGDATESIAALNETWDLVFIDADKPNYINYYEQVMTRVKSGGYILADNVLFHGEVLAENITGKNAKAIAAFNAHVKADNRVEHSLLTIRDGLMLIRKK